MTYEDAIKRYEPMIHAICYDLRISPTSLHFEDCINAGRLGIIEAVDGWDDSKSKLSTFMYRCIRCNVMDEMLGAKKYSCLYGNMVSAYSYKKGIAPKVIWCAMDDEHYSYPDNRTALDDIYLHEQGDLIDRVDQVLTDNFGKRGKDIILRAFDSTGKSFSNGKVKNNYDFIYKNYHHIRKYLGSQSGRRNTKILYNTNHMWNWRIQFMRLAIKVFAKDDVLKHFINEEKIYRLLGRRRKTWTKK